MDSNSALLSSSYAQFQVAILNSVKSFSIEALGAFEEKRDRIGMIISVQELRAQSALDGGLADLRATTTTEQRCSNLDLVR